MPDETETTNKVLETMIGSLSKITDVRLNSLEKTLERIESANLVTIASFNKKEEAQDIKIETLITANAKLEGSIVTVKVLGAIITLVMPIIIIIISHYWK